jgi:hypothetical protein
LNTFALNPAESFLPTTAERSPQQKLFPWLPGKPAEPESTWTRSMWIRQARQFANCSRDRKERELALASEKIRPLCCNHPVQTAYSWKWPDASKVNGQLMRVAKQHGEAPGPVPEGLRYRHFLTDLYHQISAEIALGLSESCRVFEDRHSVRVEFMQRIAWVAFKNPLEWRNEVRDRRGRWQLTVSAFTLHNPLESADWIDQVLMPWLPRLSMLPEQEVQAGYDWLRASLKSRFHNPYWLRGLKRQLRFHLNTCPAFGSLLIHFGRLQGSLDLDRGQYGELCKHHAFWAEFYGRHPGLSYFCHLAVEYGLIREGDDLGELRRKCLEQGLGRVAWRFLARHGDAAFRAAINPLLGPEHVCENVLGYIEWQARAGLDKPLPIPLGRNLIAASGMLLTLEQGGVFDTRIARAANDHWKGLNTTRERRRFAEHDWVKVLVWLRDEQPKFDRNQWRAGWSAIWRSYLKWRSLHGDNSAWTSCLTAFDYRDWRITPMTSSYQLAREGLRMRHCVAGYAGRCVRGNYRLFSVACQFTGKPLATVGLLRKDNEWQLEQVKGPCNREPSQVIRELAGRILERYQSAEAQALLAEQKIRTPDLEAAREIVGICNLRVSRFCGPSLLQVRENDGRWRAGKPEDYFLPRELIENIQMSSLQLKLLPPFALPDEDEWQALDDLVFDISLELREALPRGFRVFRDDGFAGGEVEVVLG